MRDKMKKLLQVFILICLPLSVFAAGHNINGVADCVNVVGVANPAAVNGVAAAGGGYSDTFTGDNGTALATHDANWTAASGSACAVSTVTINTNSARQAGWCDTAPYGRYYYAASSSDYSKVVTIATQDPNKPGALVRASDSNPGYSCWFRIGSGGKWTQMALSKNTTNVATAVIDVIDTVPHTIELTASGTSTTNLSCKLDGTEVLTYADSTTPYTSGSSGMMMMTGTSTAVNIMDSWTDTP